MIKYDIKTWRCSECDYAYSGAMPPNENEAYLKSVGVAGMDCPKCGATDTVRKVTDPAMKSKHNACEYSDVDAKRSKLEAEPKKKHEEEDRDETAEEKTERIDMELANMKPKTPEQIAAHRAQFEDK